MSTADELRAAFDGAFALPAELARPDHEDLLAVTVAGRAHAIRVAELAGVFAGRQITPVPSRKRGVIGVAGFRGVLVPIFDLATLLGLPMAATPRWIAVTARGRVGLAFDHLERHLRRARAAGVPAVELEGRTIPVVDIDELVDSLVIKERP